MSGRNPLHPEALTLADVCGGRLFQVVNTIFGAGHKGRFTSKPFDRGGYVRAHAITAPSYPMSYGGIKLADIGIMPYPDGRWNRRHYCLEISLEDVRISMPGLWLAERMTDSRFRADMPNLLAGVRERISS